MEVTNTTFSEYSNDYSDDASEKYSEVIRVYPKSCITVVLLLSELYDEESDVYEVYEVYEVSQVILSSFLFLTLTGSSFNIISCSEQSSSSSSINILILGYISTIVFMNY